MNAVQKLQAHGLGLMIAAGLLTCTAPSYNGQWLLSVVCAIIGLGLLLASKVVEHRR